MRRGRLLLGLVILLVLAGAGMGAWLSAPRLRSYTPALDESRVALDAPLELVFSQPMQPGSLRLDLQPPVKGQLTWKGARLVFKPDNGWPSGALITVTLQSGGRAVAFPGLPLLQPISWSFRTRPVLLAYLWPTNDLADLYALNPFNGQVLRLTVDAGVRDFRVSPNGRWIYYTVDKLAGGSLILRLDLQAGLSGQPPQTETVLDCSPATCRQPAPAPDGRFLAYERAPLAASGNMALVSVWKLDLKSGEQAPVADPDQTTRYPAWSGLGWLALYNLTHQTYQLYPPQGDPLELPNQTGEPGTWHPSGRIFLAPEIFEENPGLLELTTSGHLLSYNLDRSAAPQDLTRANNIEDTAALFSPDGSQVAFARKYLDLQRWTAGRQLWLMQADGVQAHPLTDAPAYNHYSFSWSSDGQWIAFMRFNQASLTDLPELWMINSDGANPIQLVIGGYAPQWIP